MYNAFILRYTRKTYPVYYRTEHNITYRNQGVKVYYLGTGSSFNVSTYPDYKSFTVDNFLVGGNVTIQAVWETGSVTRTSTYSISKSYNNSTGILSLKNTTITCAEDNKVTPRAIVSPSVWLVY